MKRFKTYLKLKINEAFIAAGPQGGNINYSNSRRPYQIAKPNVNTSPDVYDQASRAMVNDKADAAAAAAAAAAKDAQVTKSAPEELNLFQIGLQNQELTDKERIERDASEEDLDAIRKGKEDQRQKDADERWAPKYGSSTDNGFASSGNKRRNSGNVSIPGVEEGGNISLSGQVPPTYPKQPGVTTSLKPNKSELVSASKNSNSGNNETQNRSITLDGPELENGNFASGTYNLNMNQTQKARNSDGTIINQGQEQETRLQGSAGEGDQYYEAGSVDFIGSQRQVNGVNVAQDSAISVDNPRPHPQGDENPLLNTMADRRRGHMTVNLSKTQTDNSNADNNVNPSAAPSAAELVQGSQNAAPTATSSPTQSNKPLQPVSYNSVIDENGNDKRTGKPASDTTREFDEDKKDMINKANQVRDTGKTTGTFVGGKLQ